MANRSSFARGVVTVILAELVILGLVGAWLLRGGIAAAPAPSSLETAVARRLRRWAIPSADRARTNPVPATAETVTAGLEHFADHCAVCHGNDGSGDTPIGRHLYPRAPDMRRPATQSLTDGELFYIIEQGVRLTGMPAWTTGTREGARESWQLVDFIRHLPSITPAELEQMEQLNPKPPDEWRQQQEENEFLEGGAPAPEHSHGDSHD